MEEVLKEFIEWCQDNLDDIFDLIDNPDEVIKKYIESEFEDDVIELNN